MDAMIRCAPYILLAFFCLLPSDAMAAPVIPVIAMALIQGATYAYVGYALMIGSSVYGAAQQRRRQREMEAQQRQAHNDSLTDRTINRVATNAPHRYVYGRARVGSDIVAMFTSGDRDQYKWLVCVHAAHECDAIEKIYVNNRELTLSEPAADGSQEATNSDYFKSWPVYEEEYHVGSVFNLAHVPNPPSSLIITYRVGSEDNGREYSVEGVLDGTQVTVAESRGYTCSYQWQDSVSRVHVTKHLGTSTDTADAWLMAALPDKWAPTSVLRGLCYTVVRLDLNQPEFQGGIPPIEVLVRGKKLFDPNNSSTSWSQNPALAIYDYLTSEMCGVDVSDLPVESYKTAATACKPITGCTYTQAGTTVTVNKTNHGLQVGDVREILITSGDAVSGHYTITSTLTDPERFTYTASNNLNSSGAAEIGGLYTINGIVSADQDSRKVLESMAQCMAGGIVGNTWKVWAGKYVAPDPQTGIHLDQSDIVGSLSVVGGTSDADLYNGVRGQFIGSENGYTPTDVKPYQNVTYLEADGRELWNDLNFPFTDSTQRIHNLARIFTEDQRNGFTIKATFSLKAWLLTPGDRVTFTSTLLGQTDKVYRVTDKRFGADQAVELTLKEDDASIWDFADATTVDSTPNTNLPDPFAIEPLASLSCSSGTNVLLLQDNGTVISRIHVTWPEATTPGVVHGGAIEVEWKRYNTSSWSKVHVSGDETSVYLAPLKDGAWYSVRARTVNLTLNVKSIWTYASHQVIGKTERPSPVTAITATPNTLGVTLQWEEISDPDRRDYLICDDAGAAQVWNAYGGSSAKLPASIAGLHTYRIISRDTSKLTSLTETTCELTINAPSAPVVSSAVKDGMIDLSWNDCTATHQLKNYEVRYGATWETAEFVGRSDTRSIRITPDWTGSRTFLVAGIDISGNIGTSGSVAVLIEVPRAPTLTGGFSGDSATLTWSKPVSTTLPLLPVDMYEVRYGASWDDQNAVSLGTFRTTSYTLLARWSDARTFWVAAIDIQGNTGTPASCQLTIVPPATPFMTVQVIDNNVLLRWAKVSGTLGDAVSYELRRGSTNWSSAEKIGLLSGEFTVVFETLGGVYTYWIAGIDRAGNMGGHSSLAATVAQPPDYVLKDNYDLDFSVGTKYMMSYHADDDNSWIVPTDESETVEQHLARSLLHAPDRFDDSAWVKLNATVSGNAITVEGGAKYADKLQVDATAAAQHAVNQISVREVMAGTQLTQTVRVKASEHNEVYLSFAGGASYAFSAGKGANLNLNTGTVSLASSGVTTNLTSLGNGEYEFSITATADNAGGSFPVRAYVYVADSTGTGDGRTVIASPTAGNGIYVWEHQLALGSSVLTRWNTPKDQIDAGFPIYIQPNAGYGYYEETIDYETNLATNRITVTLTAHAKGVGIVSSTCKISTSPDVSPQQWTHYDNVWQACASNFRYVKVRVTFTPETSTDLLELAKINVRLDTKMKSISNMIDCKTGIQALTSISQGSPAVMTLSNHDYVDGDRIQFSTGGALPAPLVVATDYYVRNATANTFNVSATPAGALISTTNAGSGQHSSEVDVGGTIVYLTDDWTETGEKVFIDVTSISPSPQGTSPVIPMYDFQDLPNPLSLKLLMFNNSGQRTSAKCSLTVDGI